MHKLNGTHEGNRFVICFVHTDEKTLNRIAFVTHRSKCVLTHINSNSININQANETNLNIHTYNHAQISIKTNTDLTLTSLKFYKQIRKFVHNNLQILPLIPTRFVP